MKKKINVAELLKDYPRGMELDCAMYNKVTLLNVDIEDTVFPIRVKREDGNPVAFTKYGQYINADFAECVIFPKGRTTWEGFVPPCKFKDGDIIYVKDKYNQEWCSILSNYEDEKLHTYVDFCITSYNFHCSKPNILCEHKDIIEHRFATEEEKQKLFDAIKANGYKWNEDTKTLEKLLKFKVGDWVVNRFGDVWHIDSFDKKNYQVSDGNGYYSYFPISVQDKMHLWTIQDAKNGDVLVDKYNNIGIFQKCEGIYWYSYIYLGCDGKIRGFSIGGCHEQTDTHPATKEQRGLLFTKMNEVGYKWNEDTKTLEKLVVPNTVASTS